jgi:hypothetical protein
MSYRKRPMTHDRVLGNTIIGIDGEGWDVGPEDEENGRTHTYGLLLAADENGRRWSVSNAGSQVTTKQCLDFLFTLPADHLIIAFSFKYDLAKMLEDLPNSALWQLNHGSLENGPVVWCPIEGTEAYELSYLAGKFTVRRGKKERVIWDFFKFYACAFVKALKQWSVGLEALKEIEDMKGKRGSFTVEELPEISHYCYLECVNLARLGRKLIDAMRKARIDLDGKYYGAGSVGGALLASMNGEEENAATKTAVPQEMRDPVKRAFFGGRFEISECGPIVKPCFERDISSAYPYQTCRIPCMRQECGQWRHIDARSSLTSERYALVRYSLYDRPTRNLEWGPLPFRTAKGAHIYPHTSAGGWVWLDEFLAAERLWDNVKFVEAWVWDKHCDHPNPFMAIAEYYRERCALGKDGAGLAIKLGVNSFYGKTAQTIGKAKFHNWAWCGMITSGCRAQLLNLLGMHEDMGSVFMLATDGVYSTERLGFDSATGIDSMVPLPIDTGTGIDRLVDEKGKPVNKPLGGWETTAMKDGMFVIRPGIYFKLNDLEGRKVRSRGIGAREMTEARERLMAHFAKTNGAEPYSFTLTRFCGMKTSIGGKEVVGLTGIPIEDGFYRRPYYGRWATRQHVLSFSPMPKRGEGFALRGLPEDEFNVMSAPYSKKTSEELDEETAQIQRNVDELLEQPDYDDLSL